MKFLTQTRLYRGDKPEKRGNCYPTVIACLLDIDDPEDVLQIQEHYHEKDSHILMYSWLEARGFTRVTLYEHQYDDEPYLVGGMSHRDVNHICIYRNGKLLHDPHPQRTGLKNEELFYKVIKLTDLNKYK